MVTRRRRGSTDVAASTASWPSIEAAAEAGEWSAAAEFISSIGDNRNAIRSQLDKLNSVQRIEVARAVRRLTPELFMVLLPTERAIVLEDLQVVQAVMFVRELPENVRHDTYRGLPASGLQRLLSYFANDDDDDRREIDLVKGYLRYPRHSVGEIMAPLRGVIVMHTSHPVNLAIVEVRARPTAWPIVCVVDEMFSLVGVLHAADLLSCMADGGGETPTIGQYLASQGLRSFPFVEIDAPQQAAIGLLRESTWPFIPVVDGHNRGQGERTLVGIVSAATALAVLEYSGVSAASDSANKSAFVSPDGTVRPRGSSIVGDEHSTAARAAAAAHAATSTEGPTSYSSSTVLSLVVRRLPWLIVLVILNIGSTILLGRSEAHLAKHIALAAFIPLVVGMGGNTGTQSSSLLIAALASRDTKPRDLVRTLAKEAAVGALLAMCLAALAFCLATFQVGAADIGTVVAAAMVIIVLVANLLGAALPFVITAAGGDPSVAASPLLTSCIDIIGIATYLASARIFLP